MAEPLDHDRLELHHHTKIKKARNPGYNFLHLAFLALLLWRSLIPRTVSAPIAIPLRLLILIRQPTESQIKKLMADEILIRLF